MLSKISGNNQKVQVFALKSGSINLAVQLEREANPKIIEGIIGAFASILKSDNFPGKRQYISDDNVDGLR